tara:strand:- start:309 stop:1037 length:729 start_codon:yes stop_codon:yes gene_type:complete
MVIDSLVSQQVPQRRAVIDDVVDKYFDYCSSFTFKLKNGLPGQAIHRAGFVNCYVNVKNKIVYLHVDKCGSTSITAAFITEGMSFIPLDQFPRAEDYDSMAKFFVDSGYTFFAMTRDPHTRWVSGMNEFMCRYKPPFDWVQKSVMNKKYVYDEHTAPQHLFLRLCLEYNGNLHLIKLDNNLKEKVNDFLGMDLDIQHLRQSKYFVPNYTMLAKKLFHKVVQPDMEEFKKLYALDYELYDSAE